MDRLFQGARFWVLVGLMAYCLTIPGICAGQAGIENNPVPPAERYLVDCTKIYDALNPAIVKIHADGGFGSGFLVTPTGLIATNHHVVANSRYLAAEFSDGRKVQAILVVLDPRHDVAILKVHSSLVQNIRPLELLSPDQDSLVLPGIPVLAFGSPLSQTFLMTQGVVAKVEDEVLLGDFLIQPGNSGGPLVRIDGRVVGINTFAVSQISGAVRVNVLREILQRPDVKSYERIEPSAEMLPKVRAKRYPPETLKNKILGEKVDPRNYAVDGGKFVVTAITPVLIGRLQIQENLIQAMNRYSRRGKKIQDPNYQPIDEPFYEWQRNAASFLDYAVTMEIKPDFGTTSGSKWMAVLSAMSNTTATMNYEFKAEFENFKLYRDGEFIPPLHPGRQITEQSMVGTYYVFIDEAYSGMYQYAPEVFMSGNEFRMEIFDAREPGKIHKTIKLDADSKMIQQIRADFSNIGG